MVMPHGIGGSARTWDLVRPALAREHDLLAPTPPGHLGGPPLPPGGGLRRALPHADRIALTAAEVSRLSGPRRTRRAAPA